MIEHKPNDNPSGGNYTVTDPLTGILCTATTFEGLVHRVGQVRSAIGARAGLSLREELEKAVCELYPKDCIPIDMAMPRPLRLTLTDMIRGTVVLASHLTSGAIPVDRSEAERRALICKECKFNVRVPLPCVGMCGEILQLAQKISGGHGTQYDRSLHSCSVCRCWNGAQIWIGIEHLDKGLTDDMRKQFKAVPWCWKGQQLALLASSDSAPAPSV